MEIKVEIPIVIRRAEIIGPAGVREMDVVLDTGAVYTVYSCGRCLSVEIGDGFVFQKIGKHPTPFDSIFESLHFHRIILK